MAVVNKTEIRENGLANVIVIYYQLLTLPHVEYSLILFTVYRSRLYYQTKNHAPSVQLRYGV